MKTKNRKIIQSISKPLLTKETISSKLSNPVLQWQTNTGWGSLIDKESLSERSHYFTARVCRERYFHNSPVRQRKSQNSISIKQLLLSVTPWIIIAIVRTQIRSFFLSLSHTHTQCIWDSVAVLFWVTLRCGVGSIQRHTRQSNTKSISAVRRLTVQTHSLSHVMQAKRKKYLSSLLCSRRNQFIFLSFLSKQISPFLWS